MPRRKKNVLPENEALMTAQTVTAQEDETGGEAPVPASKTARKPKTAPEGLPEEIIVQYGGGEWSLSDLKEKAITAYVAEGHRRGRIEKLMLYVKPEEMKVYYVVNGKNAGSTDFE